MDNHESHISIPLIELAIANNVCLLGLPPHTTHILQPLDVGVFGPLKEPTSPTDPRGDAGGLSREYVLRIPSVS